MNIKAIDEAVDALKIYKLKLQNVFSEVSGPTLVKLVDDLVLSEKAIQMAVDERNDYIQNLVHCVLNGKEVEVNKYEFQEMHKYVAKEIDTLLLMENDANTNEWMRREITEHKKQLEKNIRTMLSIGYGTYGLYVADFQDVDIVDGYLERLKEVMILVERIHNRTEEIYENEVAARSEG